MRQAITVIDEMIAETIGWERSYRETLAKKSKRGAIQDTRIYLAACAIRKTALVTARAEIIRRNNE